MEVVYLQFLGPNLSDSVMIWEIRHSCLHLWVNIDWYKIDLLTDDGSLPNLGRTLCFIFDLLWTLYINCYELIQNIYLAKPVLIPARVGIFMPFGIFRCVNLPLKVVRSLHWLPAVSLLFLDSCGEMFLEPFVRLIGGKNEFLLLFTFIISCLNCAASIASNFVHPTFDYRSVRFWIILHFRSTSNFLIILYILRIYTWVVPLDFVPTV